MRLTVQLATAFILAIAGLAMLFMGLWIEPEGEIHNSVLVAFGEVSTFSGALFGVDYTYKIREKNSLLKRDDDKTNKI